MNYASKLLNVLSIKAQFLFVTNVWHIKQSNWAAGDASWLTPNGDCCIDRRLITVIRINYFHWMHF